MGFVINDAMIIHTYELKKIARDRLFFFFTRMGKHMVYCQGYVEFFSKIVTQLLSARFTVKKSGYRWTDGWTNRWTDG